MRITRIFLDVDDVLADFSMSALAYLGIDRQRIDLDSFYERFGYDLVKAANFYRMPEQFMTPNEFWNSFPRSFWAELKKTKECDKLIAASTLLVGSRNTFLLTAPIQDPDCAAGKMEWIRDTLPEFWEDRRYMIAPPKYACAYPGALLIDDCDANVEQFRKAGGMAALVPRPWNTEYNRRCWPMSFTRLT